MHHDGIAPRVWASGAVGEKLKQVGMSIHTFSEKRVHWIMTKLTGKGMSEQASEEADPYAMAYRREYFQDSPETRQEAKNGGYGGRVVSLEI